MAKSKKVLTKIKLFSDKYKSNPSKYRITNKHKK